MKIKFLFFVLFLNAVQLTSQTSIRQLELKDIWASREFIAKGVDDFRSMNDGEHYTLLENNSIIKFQFKTGKQTEVIIDANTLKGIDGKKLQIDDYQFDDSEKNILLETATERIYRHSYHAMYYVYNLKTQSLLPVSRKGKQRLASFSPDGSKLVFVRDNNLILADMTTGFETPITTDGEDRKIINGVPDWVYEEEFSFSKGFFWSPDGSKVAFMKFDESGVKEFWMTTYGNTYPEKFKYKYPKAGEDNSILSIHVYDLATAKTSTMDIGTEKDQYIPRISWTRNNNILCIQRLNRLQNQLDYLFVDASSGKSEVVYSETNKYYIDITDNLYFTANNAGMVFTSEQDGYHHIYYYLFLEKKLKQLTKGSFDIEKVYGMDEKDGLVFYSSAESSPLNRDIYSIKIDGSAKTRLSEKSGTNAATFSKGFRYFINTWSDINTPPVYSLYSRTGKKIKDIETNTDLVKTLKTLPTRQFEFFTFKTSGDIELNAWMLKPPDFDPKGKYPVLMYVYGGPASQTVVNSWGRYDFMWFRMLSQKGYIIVSVDGRGTGFRGEEFRKCTYKQLGKFETEDQIEAAKYLGGLGYVDSRRIGIFGWSYGGYMSSMCLTVGASYFKAGIAVAPVTNWRFYDNIYTERFMRTPQENPIGYDDNSPITHAKRLNGKLLLVHGTGDDNVHVENTLQFVDALIKANKQFDMMLYPNRDHGIYGGVTRLNLYTRMTDFIITNL